MLRNLAICWFFLLAGTLPAVGGEVQPVATTAKPARNVVLVVADDLGMQLGCYGDALARTPNLDRLAAAGTRFTQAYCTTASCSASRSVILTGMHNHAIGHYGHSHGEGHFSTYETVRTLPVLLSQAGYRTCSIGKYHVAPNYVYKFDAYRNEGIQGARNTVRMAENAKAWIKEQDARPFFLYFCPTDPHRVQTGFANEATYPGVTAEKFDPAKLPTPAWLPDQPEVHGELAEFYQSIARLDQGIGTLLDALRDTGHWDDTLILFISDNGPPFPGAKTTMYQPGVNLPMIVRDPLHRATVGKTGTTTAARVTWADIAPTVLEFCGVTPKPAPRILPTENMGDVPKAGKLAPWQPHGRSFLQAMREASPADRNEIYLSHTFHEITMYYPMRTIISGRHKYILNLAHPLPFPFASDLYASPTWQGVLKRKDVQYGARTVQQYVQRPRHELYDLEADPGELRNLADDATHSAVLSELQAKLKAWQTQTADPWLSKYEYE